MRKLENTRLAIIGLGYIGLLPTAEFGKHGDAPGLDVDQARIGDLRAGSAPTTPAKVNQMLVKVPSWRGRECSRRISAT